MKAIVQHTYCSPDELKLEELPKPIPADGEVLLKVCAAAVNPLDWHFIRGTPSLIRFISGVFKPKGILYGADVAGRVERVGNNVTKFKIGDEVFGMCRGAYAEYVCTKEINLHPKPSTISFAEAASVPVAAITALQGLRDHGKIMSGQQVLVNGASGGVGIFAIQIAKSFGAEVTGVCSTRNLDLVRSIGADYVIDYTQADFTSSGKCYDIILDCYANHSLSECKRALKPGGRYVFVGGPNMTSLDILTDWFVKISFSLFSSKKMITFVARINHADLATLSELLERGALKPVIDSYHKLEDTPQAISYVEKGHTRGKVIIVVD